MLTDAASHASAPAHRSAADALWRRTRSGVPFAAFPPAYRGSSCFCRWRKASLPDRPISPGLRIEPWSDRAFDAAARLIQLAYADHVDGQINDQYCSEAGSLRFLRNIVLLPGCGISFFPRRRFVVRPATGDRLIAMILTSTVADERRATQRKSA